MPSFDIAHEVGSREFEGPLRRLGLPTRIRSLTCGDFAFYGEGPSGMVRVGVERKTINEMVGDESRRRYIARQLPKMLERYGFVFLVVEGLTKPDADGLLVAAKDIKHGQLSAWNTAGWGYARNTYEMFMKRELTLRMTTSVQLVPTASPSHTAFFLHALYRWFQKPWKEHRSHLRVDTDIARGKTNTVILDERTMRREVFAKLPHISWERSARVSKHFPSVAAAVNATEEEWMVALGIAKGRTIARTLVRFLHGLDDTEREAKGA